MLYAGLYHVVLPYATVGLIKKWTHSLSAIVFIESFQLIIMDWTILGNLVRPHFNINQMLSHSHFLTNKRAINSQHCHFVYPGQRDREHSLDYAAAVCSLQLIRLSNSLISMQYSIPANRGCPEDIQRRSHFVQRECSLWDLCLVPCTFPVHHSGPCQDLFRTCSGLSFY